MVSGWVQRGVERGDGDSPCSQTRNSSIGGDEHETALTGHPPDVPLGMLSTSLDTRHDSDRIPIT